MKIRWLDRRSDLEGLNISDALLPHINTSKSKVPDLRLIFNSRQSMSTFLAQLGQYCMDLNRLKLQLGLSETFEAIDMRPENILISDIPLVYFGDDSQMNGFLKMFGDKAAVVSNKCKSKYRTIAYQRHLSDKIHLGSVSLGEFKSDFGRAESTLRNAHAILFESKAIRKQDSHSASSAITGLDIYEACNILRYCGLSTEHFFLFFNLENETSICAEQWECLSILFWYYIEGKNQAELDHIDHEENHVYLVENSYFHEPVSFIKAFQTQRWWFIHPDTKDRIPCSEQDYLSLREGQLPDILVSLTL